jgi:imidazolonepropionase
MPAYDLLIRNTSEVLCVRGEQGQPAEQSLTPIQRGAVGVTAGRVSFLGPESSLPPDAVGPRTEVIDGLGGFIGPGFVDCHTHVVFAGDRSEEFELRCRGASYAEIARAGGGIMSTVRATRAASKEELVSLARPRLQRLLEQGVTSAEAKSGYGLNLMDELKMLRAIRRLGLEQPIALTPTLLCAHAVPSEWENDRQGFVKLCTDEIIPAAAKVGLAKFCDVFVEQLAFTPAEAHQILSAGRRHGLIARVHADQLTDSGGARLAAEVTAASADHLENVSSESISALAATKVCAVLMPTTTLFLRQKTYASGRKLVDAGVTTALATNTNPGSSMSENVALTLGLACLETGLSAAEAYWALTRGGATALGFPELGQLAMGGPADLVLFACTSYRHLPYHFAINHVRTVVKAGRVVWTRPSFLVCPAP